MISAQPPVADDNALAAYEELRHHRVMGTPGAQFGLVVLLREGVAAWVERRTVYREPEAQTVTHTLASPLPPGQLHTEIAQLLASMVLNRRKERQV